MVIPRKSSCKRKIMSQTGFYIDQIKMMEVKELREKRRVRRYLMVIAPVCLFLAVIVLLGGCGSESTGTEDVSIVQETPLSVTEPPKVSVAPKQTPEVEKEDEEDEFNPMEITKGDLESNFDEAMKHITICGKKVSFPLTLKQFGKDFTFKKSEFQPKGTEDLMGDLYYKGKSVATAWITNGRKKGNINKKKIDTLTFSRRDSSDEYELVDLCGVKIDSNVETALDIFGEPTSGDASSGHIKYKKGGKKDAKSDLILDFSFGSFMISYNSNRYNLPFEY